MENNYTDSEPPAGEIPDDQLAHLNQSDLFLNISYPVKKLIRSMVFDTLGAILILIAYFYTVLQLTPEHFSRLWNTIILMVLFAMSLQVLIVSMLGRPALRCLLAIKRRETITRELLKKTFLNLYALPFNLTASGLFLWTAGIIFSAYWLRFHISLEVEKVILMSLGGVIAAIGTNSFAFFRVRNISRPYLSELGTIKGMENVVPAKARLYKELLYTFLLLITFILAMSSIFHFALIQKLMTLIKTTDQVMIAAIITDYINQTRLMILVLIVLSLALAIGLASAAARNITEPLNKLKTMAHTIASGDLGQKIPYLSSDEIGVLANNFELMRKSLQKTVLEKEKARQELENINIELALKINDLERLAEASKELSASIEYQQIVDTVLDSFTRAVAISHGSLYLFEQEKGALILSKAYGIVPDVKELPLSKGEIQWIEARPKPLFLDTIEREIPNPETFEKWNSLWLTYDVAIALPLFIEGKPIGFVILGEKENNQPFTTGEINLLTTLSNQAAIAINNSRLYEQATVDSLTKLFLRRYFQHRLQEEIWRVRRYGHSLSVVMMDIDHFKHFNDTYGHMKGDKVLQHVSLLVKNVSRDTDIPARFGGEEFIILLPETSLEGAQRIAERVRSTIEENLLSDQEHGVLKVTVSAGVAEFEQDDEPDGSTLIKKADDALYRAKNSGRNRICTYKSEPWDNSD
ncbi:diguanylate cyclase [candidate division CSSED10-310 bacterium]|uniref:Diguanylate cyclase n=1 Tax=candidate division CSSED10-310 bacterium TaxID=2855610 RepID=A0ABV6Z4Y7_UNCC1